MDGKFIEKFSGVFLIAGLLFFLIAFFSLAVIPVWMVEKIPASSGLPEAIPAEFSQDFSTLESYQQALFRGRDLYIQEGCWHCHSQFVRPTANENLRYGPVSTPAEYQSPLHLPHLFGTRRVGPDLSREAGKKSNDWHYAHLYKPTNVVPESVMPEYPWFFKKGKGAPLLNEDGEIVEDEDENVVLEDIFVPNEDGVSIVAYLQWLGKDALPRSETRHDLREITLPPRENL